MPLRIKGIAVSRQAMIQEKINFFPFFTGARARRSPQRMLCSRLMNYAMDCIGNGLNRIGDSGSGALRRTGVETGEAQRAETVQSTDSALHLTLDRSTPIRRSWYPAPECVAGHRIWSAAARNIRPWGRFRRRAAVHGIRVSSARHRRGHGQSVRRCCRYEG